MDGSIDMSDGAQIDPIGAKEVLRMAEQQRLKRNIAHQEIIDEYLSDEEKLKLLFKAQGWEEDKDE